MNLVTLRPGPNGRHERFCCARCVRKAQQEEIHGLQKALRFRDHGVTYVATTVVLKATNGISERTGRHRALKRLFLETYIVGGTATLSCDACGTPGKHLRLSFVGRTKVRNSVPHGFVPTFSL